MAKIRKKPVAPVEDPAGIDLEDMFSAEQLNPALEAVYAEMGITDGGQAVVHISKLDADGAGNEAKVWKGDPDDYDLESLAKKFGSGQYRVKVYVRNADGAMPCRGNKVFGWLLSPEDEARVREARNPRVSQPSYDTPIMAALDGVTKTMAGIAETLKAIQTPHPGGGLASLKEAAELLRVMMPAPAQGGGMDTVLSTISMALKLGEQFKGSGAGAQVPVDDEGKADVQGMALSRGIDLIAKLLERGVQQAPAQVPAAALPAPAAAPHVNGGAPIQPQQEAEPDMDELELAQVKIGILLANKKARAGMSPEDYADEVYESLPDEMLGFIAMDPEWFTRLSALAPDCVPIKLWWEKVHDKIIEFGLEDKILARGADGAISLSLTEGEDSVRVAGNGADIKGSTDLGGTGPK